MIKNETDSMVVCQLCHEHVRSAEIIKHLKGTHQVIDDALYDDKPLRYWYKIALTE